MHITSRVSLLSWRLSARVSAPGDRNYRRGPCTAWRLAARYAPPGDACEIVSLETLAPGRRKVPPGDLSLCRLAVLGAAPGNCVPCYDLCVLLLIDNDAMLGSGDAVP